MSILSVLQVILAFSKARLTRTDSTPGTLETADSTDATQEEQVMPLTRSVVSATVNPLCYGHSLLIISIDVRQEISRDVQTKDRVHVFCMGRVVQVRAVHVHPAHLVLLPKAGVHDHRCTDSSFWIIV